MAATKSSSRTKAKTAQSPAEDGFGRLQPQDLEFERAVLAALILERDAYSIVGEILKPETFYDPRHQAIYSAIQRLNVDQRPADLITIKEQLQSTNQLEEAGGAVYLSQVSMQVVSAAHLEFHARILAQKATARQLISYTNLIQSKAFDPTTDIDELMQEAEGKLFELSQKNLKQDYIQIDPVLNEAYEMIHKAAAQADGMSGIPSLFTKLDAMTSGWQNSDLVIMAARPAMGKTAFALSMAKNMAFEQDIPVAFFSLEMSKVQLVNRLISNACEIPSDKIKNGRLEQYEWMQLDQRLKELYGKPLYLDDTPSLSVFELRTKARRLVREHGVRVIMIDYLQLMNASGMNFGSRQEEVSTISRSLKGLAKELNIPILALSQLNRGTENRVGTTPDSTNDAKRPQLSDLRESGAIEQDADMVLFIHRPEYYRIYKDNNGVDLRGKAEIIIAKHRNGAVGDVLLTFKGEFTRFENAEDQEAFPLSVDELPPMYGDSYDHGESSLASPPKMEVPYSNGNSEVPF